MSDNGTLPKDGDLGRLIDLIESRALPLLERIAVALERSGSLAAASASLPVQLADARSSGIAEARRAIEEGRWDLAGSLARDLASSHPDDPAVAALVRDQDRARQFAAVDLRERIEAARLANDPVGAIDSRDELALILESDAIREVDRGLVKWLMAIVQRRLRTGTIQPDVVALAGRIGESFGGTTEGASLRASLPTLRRSAGLCPRCAGPYAGLGDACPKCLAASAAPTPTPAEVSGPSPDDDPDAEAVRDPLDLNDERFWEAI